MESQMVRKRVNIIAGHLAAVPEDISATATATHIFPMSCSNSLNSVIRRCDNRTFFARQGSGAQGFFMRQGSSELSFSNNLNSTTRRYDNRTFFARQGSSAQGCFMRPVSSEQGNQSQPATPPKSPSGVKKIYNSREAPMFSRPSEAEPSMQNEGQFQSAVQSFRYKECAPEAPNYARPNRVGGYSWSDIEERTHAFGSKGYKWSPRMDIAETGSNYVVTVELPGVGVDDIRVEVSDQSLTVTGSRSVHLSKVTRSSNDSVAAFHKKEIFQGPYQVVWYLPTNVNKDQVSADFGNGLLRITVPKLSEISSRMLKANI